MADAIYGPKLSTTTTRSGHAITRTRFPTSQYHATQWHTTRHARYVSHNTKLRDMRVIHKHGASSHATCHARERWKISAWLPCSQQSWRAIKLLYVTYASRKSCERYPVHSLTCNREWYAVTFCFVSHKRGGKYPRDFQTHNTCHAKVSNS